MFNANQFVDDIHYYIYFYSKSANIANSTLNSLYIESDSIDSFAGANDGTSYSKEYTLVDTDIFLVVRASFKYNDEY